MAPICFGKLPKCCNYKDNELHGEYAQFNWGGKYLWQYGTFENGKRTLWMEYNEGDGPTTIAFLAERKQQLQVLDSIAVSAIASNFSNGTYSKPKIKRRLSVQNL